MIVSPSKGPNMRNNDTIAVRHVKTKLHETDLKRLIVRNDLGTRGSHQVKSVELRRDEDGQYWLVAEVVD